MEEVKKETANVEEVKKEETKSPETFTKQEVEDLLNKKIAAVFGDLIKEINKPVEKKEETPKEKTLKELRF